MATSTYYFDASDAAITDPLADWTNDANAADGSTATSASSASILTDTAKYIQIEGTNFPDSSGIVTRVRARLYIGTSGSYSNYVTLTAPTGGWTTAQVQGLETRSYFDPDVTNKVRTNFYENGTAGGTSLGISSSTNGGTGPQLYRIEIEVETRGSFYPNSLRPSIYTPGIAR